MICPRCSRPGEHPTDEACIAAIRSAMRAKVNLPPVWTPAAVKPPRKGKKDIAGYNPHELTISQAMAVTQMSKSTIYKWIRDGKIERVYLVNGSPRIIAASLWRTTTLVKSVSG